jgi:transcriptional regulator with XRE-family HTH domain
MNLSPKRCIQKRPSKQTIRFAGEYISLSQLARETTVDVSTLSRVLAGKRNPSLDVAKKMAPALGMTIDDFLHSLAVHIDTLKITPQDVVVKSVIIK